MRSRSRVVLGAAVAAVAVAVVGPGVAGAAVPGGGLSFSPSSHNAFSYGSVSVGQSSSQVFTLTQNGFASSGKLAISLRGSRAYAITANSCTGVAGLAPGATCQVTVSYTPRNAGRPDRALLWVSTQSWFWWHGWHSWNRMVRPLFLSGSGKTSGSTGGTGSGGGGTVGGTGPASLTLLPATQTSAGVWSFNFGQVKTLGQVFTITNVGGAATAPLTLSNFSDDGGFSITADLCSNQVLAPGQFCTFIETWTANADPVCDGAGTPDSDTATVTDANQAYIEADLSATCA
jgi:hypothetical protein